MCTALSGKTVTQTTCHNCFKNLSEEKKREKKSLLRISWENALLLEKVGSQYLLFLHYLDLMLSHKDGNQCCFFTAKNVFFQNAIALGVLGKKLWDHLVALFNEMTSGCKISLPFHIVWLLNFQNICFVILAGEFLILLGCEDRLRTLMKIVYWQIIVLFSRNQVKFLSFTWLAFFLPSGIWI